MPGTDEITLLGRFRALASRAKSAIEDAIADLPVEMFLDQANTKFVPSFTWSNELYPGSTNPNKAAVEADPEADPPVAAQPAVVFNGKPVLVLAVKGVDNSDPTDTTKQTISYSFLDVSTLVDTYTVATGDSAKVLSIAGYTITFNVSAAANNAITVQNDGLHVDISGKADKVIKNAAQFNPYDETTEAQDYADFNSSYTMNGKVALLDTNGNLKDSGIVGANVLTTADLATDAAFTAMLNEIFGTPAA
mgnify:CR=1 FL=1